MKVWVKKLSILMRLIVIPVSLSGCGSQAKAVKTENVSPASGLAMEEQGLPKVLEESELRALKDKASSEGALNPIYFEFDNYTLKPEAKTTLYKTAAWLSKNPTVKIKIEGNCDERGTVEYNVALGELRANSAEQFLIKLGIVTDRLSTISYGKEKPICTQHNEACWWKNRRDEFRIIE